jgi:hypothetical protein
MAYLAHFDYSPDLPVETAEEFSRKVNHAANGIRIPRTHPYAVRSDLPATGEVPSFTSPHRIYALSDLFAATPPSDLPPYPSSAELTLVRSNNSYRPASATLVQTTTEALTYHPLLTDALHALLLCHCLLQTSAKELLRHAYMVARLARLADGYPVFQASRSPARADWIEVLRRGENWIQLAGAWEDLCAPAPLPLFQAGQNVSLPPQRFPGLGQQYPKRLLAPAGMPEGGNSERESLAPPTTGGTNGESPGVDAKAQRRELIRQQAILEALEDDRVTDEASFRAAIRARQRRAELDYRIDNAINTLDSKPQELGDETPTADAKPTAGKTKTGGDAVTGHCNALVRAQGDGAVGDKRNGNGSAKTATAAVNTGARRWAVDDGREYPILTERAAAVARWVCEAPANAGSGNSGGKRKKRPAKKPALAAAAGPQPALAGGEAGEGDPDGGALSGDATA